MTCHLNLTKQLDVSQKYIYIPKINEILFIWSYKIPSNTWDFIWDIKVNMLSSTRKRAGTPAILYLHATVRLYYGITQHAISRICRWHTTLHFFFICFYKYHISLMYEHAWSTMINNKKIIIETEFLMLKFSLNKS